MLPSWQIAAYLLGLAGVLVYFGIGSLGAAAQAAFSVPYAVKMAN